ncbi:MAG TPA: DUF1801 domain-containing protein [Polyangia bacterium]|jgi:uncharacterized protein YdhG (YjbR/CyaY superfamily)|nr:DUF1801 domain-containing protein [Polyangia bacterium]
MKPKPKPRAASSAPPATIDAYLANVAGDRRAALEDLRRTILAIVPRAEECISYRMPAFRVDGRVIAGFTATVKGCSYFPFSGRTLRTLKAELAGYGGTKSALHFDPTKPLPKTLVRKLIRARLAEG